MKQAIRILTAALSVLCAFVWCMAGWFESRLPDEYWINDTETVQLSQWVTAVQTESVGRYAAADNTSSNTRQLSLRLFGCIPLKTATAKVVDTPVVMLGGMPLVFVGITSPHSFLLKGRWFNIYGRFPISSDHISAISSVGRAHDLLE